MADTHLEGGICHGYAIFPWTMSSEFILGLLECETYLRAESHLMEPESSETSSDAVCWSEADLQTVACVGTESHGYEDDAPIPETNDIVDKVGTEDTANPTGTRPKRPISDHLSATRPS